MFLFDNFVLIDSLSLSSLTFSICVMVPTHHHAVLRALSQLFLLAGINPLVQWWSGKKAAETFPFALLCIASDFDKLAPEPLGGAFVG